MAFRGPQAQVNQLRKSSQTPLSHRFARSALAYVSQPQSVAAIITKAAHTARATLLAGSQPLRTPEVFAASVILSDIALARTANRSEPTKADEKD